MTRGGRKSGQETLPQPSKSEQLQGKGEQQQAKSRGPSRLEDQGELPNLNELYQQATSIFRADQALTRTSSNPLKIFPLSKFPARGSSTSPFMAGEVPQEEAAQGNGKVSPKKVRRQLKTGRARSKTAERSLSRGLPLSPRSSSPQQHFKIKDGGRGGDLLMLGKNVLMLPSEP